MTQSYRQEGVRGSRPVPAGETEFPRATEPQAREVS